MITHVALIFNGITYSLPKPNRHDHVIRHIVDTTGVKYVDSRGRDQGFLDDTGAYLNRKEALAHALACKQVKDGSLGISLGELYSEDIW